MVALNPAIGMVLCGYPHCRTPAFQVIDGKIYIKSRHHGEVHIKVLTREEVIALFDDVDSKMEVAAI